MNGKQRNWTRDWEGLAIPAVLILTGMVLLSAAAFGLLSFDRIQNLWPFAVILIGLCELLPNQSGQQQNLDFNQDRRRATPDA